ncbi:UNVERIFIED_ORG: hypothetical protein M2414_004177 [Rahnella aquatilis]
MDSKLYEIIEKYMSTSTNIDKTRLPQSTWNSMIFAYSVLLCDQMGSSVINDLLSLPKLVGAAAIKDALLILDSPSNRSNPRDGNTLKETPLQDIASGKELVLTFQQPIVEASSSHDKSNIKKYKKTILRKSPF